MGEVASLFDPQTGTHEAMYVGDMLFCHGMYPKEDGNPFQMGGDDLDADRWPLVPGHTKIGLRGQREYKVRVRVRVRVRVNRVERTARV